LGLYLTYLLGHKTQNTLYMLLILRIDLLSLYKLTTDSQSYFN
jgi:hypothetical protein